MEDSGASEEREWTQADPNATHGVMIPELRSAAETFTDISPKRLSRIEAGNWVRPGLVTLPLFIGPAALGPATVVRVVQLPLPFSFWPVPKPGSVYQPKFACPVALELSPSRSPCQMHMPTRTPPELLPSNVIRRSPSLRIGTWSLPLLKVPPTRFSSNETFALPEPSRRSKAP